MCWPVGVIAYTGSGSLTGGSFPGSSIGKVLSGGSMGSGLGRSGGGGATGGSGGVVGVGMTASFLCLVFTAPRSARMSDKLVSG